LKKLWGEDPEIPQVRVFTYNRLLMEWIRFLAAKLGEDAPMVTTFNTWARTAMKGLGVRYTPEYDDDGAELLALTEEGTELPKGSRTYHVLVDEGQDLSPEALQVLKLSAQTSFTVAADKAQNIYPTGFTWKGLGIKVQGRTRSLSPSFRGTEQIAALAADVVRHDPGLETDDWIHEDEGRAEGPVPEIYFYSSWAGRDAVVRRVISEARVANRAATVALLHAQRKPVYGIARNFDARILDNESPDMVSPGVLASTIHRVKGLEFDTVVLLDANEGLIPTARFDSPDDEREAVERFRRIFYVAVTRARRRLVIMADHKKPSRYIRELDPSHYVRHEC
jgi:superfamily I DNA/RNA helicase